MEDYNRDRLGIYQWNDSGITKHIGRFEDIVTSFIVRSIHADAGNHVGFSTQGYVRYYPGSQETETRITRER